MISPEQVKKRAVDLIKNRSEYEYFFSRLSSSEWIVPLGNEGFFTSPPDPIADGDYARVPVWPESQYLARVAGDSPELVRDVILRAPTTKNFRVLEDFVDAALKMPPEISISQFRPR